MRLAFFSTKKYEKEAFAKANLAGSTNITFFTPSLSQDTMALSEGFEAVCVFVNDKVDAAVLSGLKAAGVRLVALRSAGFNHVDLVAADNLGIKVVRVPAYSPSSVAEHAVGLVLTLARRIHKAYNRVREGNFSLEGLTGFELRGKVIGVIGTGKIGADFAKIMHHGFGCTVIAYDPIPSHELESSGIMYTSLEKIYSESDVISLHCPLRPETKHIINAKSFELMKPNVLIVNTGRGALIDTKAVIEALKKKQIGQLALDVYEYEDKLFFKDLSETVIEDDLIARLLTFPNVLITAHQAFLTDTALEQIAEVTLSNILAFEKGEKLENEVNASFVK